MKNLAVLCLCAALASCAETPISDRNDVPFADRSFAPPTERIRAEDVFAVSDAMQRYLTEDIAAQLRLRGRKQGLIDALYAKNQLKLEYDAGMTRNAAQTFDARAGNCLSLVIMTAAFARQLGLSVRYQLALVDDSWSRNGDLYLSIGHVNLVLGRARSNVVYGYDDDAVTTVDFQTEDDLSRLPVRALSEATVIAMYMNNRAVESLAQGHVDNAYWYAREAVKADPQFLYAYNTLGAIYSRHGNWREARSVLRAALAREPQNRVTMANLILVYDALGESAESRSLSAELRRIEPNPPFADFNRGLKAMQAGDFQAARDYFSKEIARDPYYHEFHYWLGLSYLRLGDIPKAREQLALAKEDSTTHRDYDLYAAKLDRLNAMQAH